MTTEPKTESDHLAETRTALVAAAQAHVPFDGWSAETFRAAVADAGVDPALADCAAPRGAIDLAVAYHRAGDEEMKAIVAAADLSALKYREKVIFAVRTRIEIAARDREVTRRGVTLFALPVHAAEGARLIWGTADAIWTALGDDSRDYNWYSKRAILSGVYSSTVLYWLGDDSPGAEATWGFLDRRIEDVMRFEKTKAQIRGNKLLSALFWAPRKALSRVSAPSAVETGAPVGLPGRRG